MTYWRVGKASMAKYGNNGESNNNSAAKEKAKESY